MIQNESGIKQQTCNKTPRWGFQDKTYYFMGIPEGGGDVLCVLSYPKVNSEDYSKFWNCLFDPSS